MRVYLDDCCYNRPFDVLTNREPRDYTKWREGHMYIGESVRETAARTKAAAARLEATTMAMA